VDGNLAPARSMTLDVREYVKSRLHVDLKKESGDQCPLPTFWVPVEKVPDDKISLWTTGLKRTFIVGNKGKQSECYEASDEYIRKETVSNRLLANRQQNEALEAVRQRVVDTTAAAEAETGNRKGRDETRLNFSNDDDKGNESQTKETWNISMDCIGESEGDLPIPNSLYLLIPNSLLADDGEFYDRVLIPGPPLEDDDTALSDLSDDIRRVEGSMSLSASNPSSAFKGTYDQLTVVPAPSWKTISHTQTEQLPKVFLARDDLINGEYCGEQLQQGYAKVPGKQPLDVWGCRLHPDWGKKFSAIIYPRVGPNLFEAPAPQDAQYVEIQQLNKLVLGGRLDGRFDHPYETLHVLEQHAAIGTTVMEFLETEEYWFIVTTPSQVD